jgi:hypothetical protein
MKNSTGLSSVPSDHLVPFTDQLRLAVAAYLARFKGAPVTTEPDLRCYLAWCAEHGLNPLAARRPHLELYVQTEETRTPSSGPSPASWPTTPDKRQVVALTAATSDISKGPPDRQSSSTVALDSGVALTPRLPWRRSRLAGCTAQRRCGT